MLDYIDTFIELLFLYHKWLSFDHVGENSVSIREWMRVVQIKDKLAGTPASLQYSLSQEECQSYELD